MYNTRFEEFIYNKIESRQTMGRTMKRFFICNTVNKYFIELRKNEYRMDLTDLIENIVNKNTLTEKMRTINFCYHLLLSSDDSTQEFINYLPFFEELYDRNLFYYRVMNKNNSLGFNNIDVISVAMHNQCVEYVYKKYRNSLPTVLTFDSHRDVQGINCKNKLMNYFTDCDSETLELNTMLYESIPFIGSVLYPMIYPYKDNNGIIFISPTWSTANQCDFDLYIDRNVDNNNNNFYSDEYKFIKNIPDNCDKLDKVKYRTETLGTIIESAGNEYVTDQFILNIDLDYFCANGNTQLPSSDSDINDLESDNRTIFDYNHIKNGTYTSNVGKQLQIEIDGIRYRIRKFIEMCISLRDNGKTPSMIILCDSTETHFSEVNIIDDIETITKCSNNFTPKYLILWLKTTLYNHLKHIYT